jgi:hypothetical protein
MLRFVHAMVLVSLALTSPLVAQRSPYAGRDTLPIKTLTPDEVQAYLAGEGMGLALPAELNGYPGPRHVLDLADSLGLTAERRALVRDVFDHMHGDAVRLGSAIVAAEASLDSAFAMRELTPESLSTRLNGIAALQGQLRYVHLAAHLRVASMLSPDEVRTYQRLRGYGSAHGAAHHHGGAQ